MPILFTLLTCIVLVGSKIIIEDANIAAVSHDDIGMIFYVALRNTDTCGYRIYTRMVRCVEEVEANDRECEMMQLLGGDMGEIRPQCFKNITLLYPNMYLHNRKGYCIIAIKFISEDNQVLEKKTNISFNTYLGGKGCKAHLLSNYYERMKCTQCDTVDLDPLDNCLPVDCHKKYLGTRSFFNRKWKRCQKVPVCIFDMLKDLPDVGYTPITNKCIDLERCIKKADLQPLDNKNSEMGEDSSYSMLLTAINCHFGKINNETGICDCKPGWTSAPFDKEPTLFPVHMCNIELSSWYDSNRSEITFVAFIIAVIAVAVAMVVVLLSFILYHTYKCLKSMEAGRPPCYCDLETGGMDESSDANKKKKKSTKKSDTTESEGTKDGLPKDKKKKKKDTAKQAESSDTKGDGESKKIDSKGSIQSETDYKGENADENNMGKGKKKGKEKEKKKKAKDEISKPSGSTDAYQSSRKSSIEQIEPKTS